MAKAYGDVAEFFVVYIREAHASDSKWPMAVPDREKILTPRTIGQRRTIAQKCLTKLKLDIPCLIDDMDNAVERAYDAHPDRLFVVDVDGTIAVRGGPGPWGFKSSLNKATKWLERKFPNVKDN